ncbi:ATP-binding protein, partial [Escherichia coli]|nr:ATP-binding protein [Escherichia coli]
SNGNGFDANIKPILDDNVNLEGIDQFDELILRCYLQLCSDVVFGYAQYEHIQPVLARAKSSISALRNVLEIVDVPQPPHLLHVISLKKC